MRCIMKYEKGQVFLLSKMFSDQLKSQTFSIVQLRNHHNFIIRSKENERRASSSWQIIFIAVLSNSFERLWKHSWTCVTMTFNIIVGGNLTSVVHWPSRPQVWPDTDWVVLCNLARANQSRSQPHNFVLSIVGTFKEGNYPASAWL